jgi:hypothetical protein
MGMEIYGDGSSYEGIFGLPSFITTSGAGAYAGVDPNLWPKWKNNAVTLPLGYTADVLEDAIVDGMIKSTDGVEKPDVMVASVKHWKMLEKSQRAKVRVTNPGYMKEAKANIGFNSVSYGDLDIVWDSNSLFGMDLDVSYGLCTDKLNFIEHSEGKWQFEKAVRPIDARQSVLVAPWMGLMYTDKRRCHFVIST